MKCIKTGSHLTFEDRLMIQKSWNRYPDGVRHPSIRSVAAELGLSETTLRRELKRGGPEGKHCMRLRDKKNVRWQYFPYDAEFAHRDVAAKGHQKGPRGKLTNRHIELFKPYLQIWRSIPAAYRIMVKEHQDVDFPCLRTFQYHAERGEYDTCVNGRKCYVPYKRKKKKPAIRHAWNHTPSHRIDDLPKEVRSGGHPFYVQMDTIHSSRNGRGGLLTMIFPATKRPFIRRLKNLRRTTIHKALRSIMKEVHACGIRIDYLVTDNGSEFINEKKLKEITGATIYFTHAFAGWEKGVIENFNRLTRRFYPKDTDFYKVTDEEIAYLQHLLTNYPRPSFLNKKASA